MNDTGDTDAARARLRQIIRQKSFIEEGDFQLASGRQSTMFFNMKKTLLDPEGANLVGLLVLHALDGRKVDHIGGLVMGAVPIVVSTVMKSLDTGRPLSGFWVRKETKDHGVQERVDGWLGDGATAVMVEDVTTTGGSVMQAVREVRGRGCRVDTVVTIVDRLEGAREALAGEGLELVAIFDRNDFVS